MPPRYKNAEKLLFIQFSANIYYVNNFISLSYPRQCDFLVKSILSLDRALPADVGEESTSCKKKDIKIKKIKKTYSLN